MVRLRGQGVDRHQQSASMAGPLSAMRKSSRGCAHASLGSLWGPRGWEGVGENAHRCILRCLPEGEAPAMFMVTHGSECTKTLLKNCIVFVCEFTELGSCLVGPGGTQNSEFVCCLCLTSHYQSNGCIDSTTLWLID